MKRALTRVIVVAILGVAVWQGAVGLRALFRKPVTHEAVIVRSGRRVVAALELRVGARRIALGRLAPGDTARTQFRVSGDAALELRWRWEDAPEDEHVWRGESITRGPLSQRLRATLRDDDGVLSRIGPVGR